MITARSAKEVRRMIREASYDSLLSELGAALSVNEDIGASTEGMLDRLEGDISDLRRVMQYRVHWKWAHCREMGRLGNNLLQFADKLSFY